MGRTAIVFSGQGAQAPGMGLSLYETYPSAKKVFERAEKLRKGTLRQCFEGGKEELFMTVNTQPCLFTVDLASAAALKDCGINADGAAGFSLGELAGLVYSGMLNFEDCFNLVVKRAEIMQAEALKKGGCLAAVLKADSGTVEKLCGETGGVYPVNYNCKGQTVVAGGEKEIQILTQKISSEGGRVIRLAVSGAFHSPYMEDAYTAFKQETEKLAFADAKIPLYSNVSANPYGKNAAQLLSLQIKSPVLWQKTIENMEKDGFDTFIEAGTGKTLCGLIKRISDRIRVYGAENKEEINALLGAEKLL